MHWFLAAKVVLRRCLGSGHLVPGTPTRLLVVLIAAATIAAYPLPVCAQGTDGEQQAGSQGSFYKPAVYGLGYGLAGLFAGGLLVYGAYSSGARLGCPKTADRSDCLYVDIILGAVAGGTIGVAYGAHVGNRRRGSLLADLATSTVLLVGTIVVGSNEEIGMIALAMPILQVAGTVYVERAIGRKRQRAGSFSASILPLPDGRVALRAAVAF